MAHNFEIFDYRQYSTPFPMDAEEICAPQEPRPVYYNPDDYYNQEVPQFYYHGNDHDNRGYYDRNDREMYAPPQIPFRPMDSRREELRSQQVSVRIRLSSNTMRNIDSLISALYQHDLRCEVSHGNVVIVSGYPPRSGRYDAAQDFLRIVVSLSPDNGASLL